jgi:hypothetical protein
MNAIGECNLAAKDAGNKPFRLMGLRGVVDFHSGKSYFLGAVSAIP